AHCMLSFTTVMRNKNLDAFLMTLILYMSFYLEKIALEKTTKAPVSTIVLLEETEMDDVLAKLEVTRIHLAKLYCNLILGEGMAEHHHMSCGKRKTSSSQKDRHFFESFYSYCSYVAWLAFRRKHFRMIQEEIGRLLRSDMFNPTLREKKDVKSQKGTIAFVLFSRKRPSINLVAQQRSPMLRTLLPLPKDRVKAPCCFSQEKIQIVLPYPSFPLLHCVHCINTIFCNRIGIIGAHRSELNPIMLMPIGMMEEEEDEQGIKQSGSSIPSNDLSLTTLRSPQSRLSNQSSVISRTMTEAD
uniref:Protein phosphatase 1 regulatory subunit 36 n=1 Tax=Nothoprocta perdicaria TaxID=30464 RepID=A0A8C6ZEI9_NOTPE